MKIFVNSAKEDWVSDRYRNEWIKNNKNICSHNYFGDKIIWLISPWTWKKIPKRILSSRTVLCTIHHIDEDKFLSNERQDFYDNLHCINWTDMDGDLRQITIAFLLDDFRMLYEDQPQEREVITQEN